MDGCCLDTVGGAGTYPVNGNGVAGSTNLPYIQLLTCLAESGPNSASLPEGAYLFHTNDKCADGWELNTQLSGRFVVTVPQNGTVGASFGGAPVDQGADQPIHNHTLSGAVDLTSTAVELASGCCATGYAGQGSYDFQAVTVDGPANLPFILLSMCQQSTDL